MVRELRDTYSVSHKGNDSVNVFVRIDVNCFDMRAKCARSRVSTTRMHVSERLLSFIVSRVVNATCVYRFSRCFDLAASHEMRRRTPHLLLLLFPFVGAIKVRRWQDHSDFRQFICVRVLSKCSPRWTKRQRLRFLWCILVKPIMLCHAFVYDLLCRKHFLCSPRSWLSFKMSSLFIQKAEWCDVIAASTRLELHNEKRKM